MTGDAGHWRRTRAGLPEACSIMRPLPEPGNDIRWNTSARRKGFRLDLAAKAPSPALRGVYLGVFYLMKDDLALRMRIS
jgi:hypothetical protein